MEQPLPPSPPQPVANVPACPYCGQTGTLIPKTREITEKRRPKFGVFWVLISLISVGIGFVLWLVMPRRKQVVSVDRYDYCTACKQPQR